MPMRASVRRRALLLLALLLPALVLAGWFVFEQAPTWFPAAPVWLRPSSAEAIPGACEALASLNAYRGSFADDAVAVSRDDARQQAEALAAETVDLPPDAVTLDQPPVLVRAIFPGVGERLAWLGIVRLETDAALGKAAVVYLDAQSGEPLAVIAAASAVDPAASCGRPVVGRRALVRQYLPVFLLMGYAVLLGLAALVWLVRARRDVPAARVSNWRGNDE